MQDIVPQEGEASQPRCGTLKLFFGYAPGMGKTRTLLEQACQAKATGVDLVVGHISKGDNAPLSTLLEELEQLPQLPTEQFDLDAALVRRPQLLVLDHLAHSNGPGCRHLRRYQDVQELLRSGINVWSTLQVGQLESLKDLVSALLPLSVSDCIPDSLFDSAQQVELVDLEPMELLDSYATALPGVDRAILENNLSALRELALRRAADRIGRRPGKSTASRTREHLLICLSAAPSNDRVIRTAARMAEAFHSDFTALHVEGATGLVGEEQRRLQTNQHLAQELGARIATVYGEDPAVQIAEYARASGVSKIILGRSIQKRRPLSTQKSLMDRLSSLSPDLDIYIIPDQPQSVHHLRRRPARPTQERLSLGDVCRMLGILALSTTVGLLFRALGFPTANIILVYILGVLCVPIFTQGRSYSLFASALSVLVYNFFFTRPYFTLLSAPSDLATFVIMFLAAILSSSLTVRIKRQAILSAREAYRTEVLLETSQKLQKTVGESQILAVTATQLNKLLERSVLFYPVDEGTLGEAVLFPLHHESLTPCLTATEQTTAQWVCKNNKHAGATTNTLPSARCLYMAIRGSRQVLAVAGIVIAPATKPAAFEKNLMVAILDECGLALEKHRMEQAKQRMEETARQEALRANLLRAISHDLRTPLTSISGNAGILMDSSIQLEEEKKQRLYLSMYEDSMWLINLVENLLSVTRMENNSMALKMEPELLEEVFQEALGHLDRRATEHHIECQLAGELLMAHMGARLIVQVLINLLNNAIKYTPPASHITLSAQQEGAFVRISVCDDGPGIPDEEKSRLFDMFYTADNVRGDGRRGLGLGLALCKSIVAAHGGAITVTDNLPHGSCFSFTLPASEVNNYE